jgi:hypothetical protein
MKEDRQKEKENIRRKEKWKERRIKELRQEGKKEAGKRKGIERTDGRQKWET